MDPGVGVHLRGAHHHGWSVSDADDTPTTVTKTFTVTGEVNGVGPGTDLADKIHASQTYLASGHVAHARATLSAFFHEVQAQTGKTRHIACHGRTVAE